ncbi:MAG: ATP-binding protein, partial [Bacteroidota bacterium]|nr:ATP-binding protein [Bacteroidota bacterium]
TPVALRGVTLDITERYKGEMRWKLLIEAGKLFSESSEFEAALDAAIQLLVPGMADLCQIFLMSPDKGLELFSVVASTPELAQLSRESQARFTLREDTRLMIFNVLQQRESVLLPEITDAFRIEHSISDEHLAFLRRMDIRSGIITPLFVGETMFGVISLSSKFEQRRYGIEDKLFLEEFARTASHALHKSRLSHDVENELARRSRLQARLELMEDVSQRVAGSLDLQELLHEAAEALVPRFADWLTIDLVDRVGDVSRIFAFHGDPKLKEKLEEYRVKYGHEATRGLVDIMREGTSVLIEHSSDTGPHSFGISPERWAALEEIGASSLIMVPLRSRRRTLGVLGLDFGHSKRHYTPDDTELAREIASRIASGIDNALLFAEARTEIEHRIQLQQTLEAAKEEVDAASRAKDQFMAALSHELRTPLTPVLATVDLLEGDPTLPADFQPLIGLIRRNVEIESRLIDDLLDMTRITKGKLRMTATDVDLHALLPEVIEICRTDIARANLQITTRFALDNSFVRGDKDRLSQVFWNVIHNATKFTPAHGVITIETRAEGGSAVIEFRDSGRGIEPSELERIFDPFEQRDVARAGRSAQSGLGLGLAISKSIIEMHGGSIEARSDGPNSGATFLVRLQSLQVKQAASSIPARPVLPANGARILFVDDHADTNAALKVLLERRGYMVSTAVSVNTGLELVRKEEFDLLVSDIGLPDGKGTDLLRLIRADEAAHVSRRPLKAIAVSGYGTEADIARSHEAGFMFHLKKPIAFPDLERAISEALAKT